MILVGVKKMELGKQIREYRLLNHMSQDELSNRIYVSRQTISNWENDKSYPDVNSLLLLSEIFQISIDQLIKGDIQMMKETIKQDEVTKLNDYSKIYSILLIASIVTIVPLYMWLGTWAFLPWGLLYASALYYALKLEKIKKDNNVQTYKEIIAFY